MSERVESVQWPEMRRCRAAMPAHVAARAFTHETVLLNLRSGQYHGINGVGGRFLAVVTAAPTVEDAVETLGAEYDQTQERIRADLVDFLDKLRARGLIELS